MWKKEWNRRDHFFYLQKCFKCEKRREEVFESHKGFIIYTFLNFKFIFERVSGTGAKWNGDRVPEADHALKAESLIWGLNPWTARTWPGPKVAGYLPEPPRCPYRMHVFDADSSSLTLQHLSRIMDILEKAINCTTIKLSIKIRNKQR